MKKRMLSMLLVMLLVFSLLPAAALAAATPPVNPEPVQDEEDALHMTKNLIDNGDGTYKVVIEAWATGQVDVHTITEAVPTDFVLVLDQSGSMNFPMDENASVTAAELYEAAGNKDGKTGYTYEEYDEYYDVYIRKNNGDSYTAYYSDRWGTYNIFSNKKGSYSTSDIYLSRVAALKTAANSFVTLVKEKAYEEEGQDSNYRVAIVGFSSSGYSTHKQVISNFKDVSDAGAADLRTAIGTVTANGGTDPQGGLDKAKDLLDARTDKTYTKADGTTAYRNTVVIFFTDGHPGNNDTADMIASANNAVDSAYKLKHNNVYPVTIFSIGVFSDGDDQPLTFASSSSYARNRPNYTGKTSGGYYLLRGNAVSTNPHNDTIADYMKVVSSEYPDAKNFLNHSDDDQRNGTDKNNRGAKDNNTYYTLASDSAALERAFTQVASSITDPSTQTTLTADAVLRDTIYTRDFDVSNATVSAETRGITWANNQVNEVAGTAQAMPAGSIDAENVKTTGEVAVSGFDYSTYYCTDGHDGKKLVITIDGITPKVAGNLYSNSGNAAIYPDDTSLTPALDIESPRLKIDTKESYVIDFNAKVELLSGAKLGYSTKNNGEFSEQTNNIYYQYNKQSMAGASANLVMNGVDTAMVHMNADKSWKQLSAIPANNIYFDDALQDVTLEYYEDGPGYNEGVTSTAASTVSAIADNQVLLYTFRGTGIDIYCTTNAAGGYIQAGLMRGDKADAENLVYVESENGKYYQDAETGEYIRIDDEHKAPEDATLYDTSLMAVRNYSITPDGADRYNVPTVSYTGLDYGTYTVRIKAVKGANYKLDGVRIYNAMANDESVYDGTNEANACFYNLREALVNDGQNVTVKTKDETQELSVYLEDQEDASAVLPGVLFIDNKDSVLREKSVVDAEGNFVLDANGEPKTELIYQDAFAAYVANGPKNEIYLSKGQGIAFTISEDAMGDHYWIGLSVPDAGSEAAVVTVNDATVTPDVASAVDMYYPITPDEDGTVVIVNQGDSMVALTNLKVTTDAGDNNRVEGPGPFKSAAPFGQLNAKTLSMAATSAAAVETTDDGGAQTMKDLIVKLFTDFVQSLFNSIARLFGK